MNESGQTACYNCTAGAFCEEGAAAALPCPAGSYSSTPGLSSSSQCSECPEGGHCSTGSLNYTLCSPGAVQPKPGEAACNKCGAGSFQVELGATACESCPGGYYCGEGASAALPCAEGTYSNTSGLGSSGQCTDCPAGAFCATGSLSPSDCAPGTVQPDASQGLCAKCAPGTFQDGEGETACFDCPAGKYCAEGASAGLPCPSGRFQNATLTGLGISMTSNDDCVACSPGHFCSTGAEAATPCSPGTVQNGTEQGSCVKCAAGTYQAGDGETACESCPGGYYCGEGASAGLPCPAGRYENATLALLNISMTSEDDCVVCPPGHFCTTGAAEATPCSPGTVQNQTAQGSCDKCAAGKYQNSSSETACVECLAGSFCEEGASAALPCEEGTYSRATNLTSAAECTTTEPGFYATTGSTAQLECRPGTVAPGTKTAGCTDCEAGTFVNVSGGQACNNCPPGHYCETGAAAPLPCAAGTYSNGTRLTSKTECTDAEPGSYATTGSTAPKLCTAGTYTDQPGRWASTPCEAGSYQDEAGATACKPCTAGHYCALGASAGLPCPSGRYQNATLALQNISMASADDCIDCPLGHFCSTGAEAATPCSPGTVQNLTEQGSCHRCAAGTYQAGSGETACATCPAGSYCEEGASAALPCLAGSYSSTDGLGSSGQCSACPTGRFCGTGSLAATDCAPGTVQPNASQGSCAKCAPGTFQDGEGETACFDCPGGEYCAGGASAGLPCPVGRFQNATLLALNISMTSAEDCVACRVGHFCSTGAEVATPCAPGTVQNETEQGSCDKCAAGRYQHAPGETACFNCPAGSYCEEGASAALPCLLGSYSSAEGLGSSVQCSACPAGSFCATGSLAATDCLPGTVQPNASQGSCAKCAAGTFQEGSGATDCAACGVGAYCAEGAAAALPCPVGRWTNRTDVQSGLRCEPCWAGHACSTGAEQPMACSPGTVTNTTALGRCAPCAAGTLQAEQAQTACEECGLGAYCPEGSSAALSCPAGRFGNESGLLTETDCHVCPVGSFCSTGGTAAVPCAAGTVANTTGLGRCVPCAAGTFMKHGGATACDACTPGAYCAEGAAAALPCPSGRFQNATLLERNISMTSADDCVVCPAGSFCSTGAAEATLCSPGSKAPSMEAARCEMCKPGSYQDAEGATRCAVCPVASYCNVSGASAPTPCPGGTWSDKTGLTSQEDCTPVVAGEWAPTGSDAPKACPEFGFRCPGAADDDVSGGSEPIIVDVGSYRQVVTVEAVVEKVVEELVETAEVATTLELEGSMEAYDATAVRLELCASLQVPCDWIVLDAIAGASGRRRRLSVIVTVLVRPPAGAAADSSDVAAELAAVLEQAQSGALVAALSGALGVSVVQTAEPTLQLVNVTVEVLRNVSVTSTRELNGGCPKGFYCNAGATYACPANTYNDRANATDLAWCVQCPSGKLSYELSLTSVDGCRPCAKGHWCSAGKEIACSRGYYNEHEGGDSQEACAACPAASTTVEDGSTSFFDCRCWAGYFADSRLESQINGLLGGSANSADALAALSAQYCSECRVGSDCEQPGISLASLPLLPGYYRTSNTSIDLRRCHDSDKDASGCVGGVGEGEGPCKAWLEGPYCRLCNVSDISRYYDSVESECRTCDGTAALPLATGGCGVVVVAAVAVLWARFQPHRNSPPLARLALRLGRLWLQLRLRAKVKQMLSFYQVATRISSVYDVPMPEAVRQLLAVFELFNINIGGIGLPLQCLGLGTYEQLLAFTMLGPLALAAALVLVGLLRAVARGEGVGASLLAVLPWLLSLSFLVFPMVSSTAFRAFSCEAFDDGREYLRADYRVRCSTDAHTSDAHEAAKGLAIAAILLYPCGISLLYMVLMFRAQHALRSDQPTALSRALAFLVKDYEPRCFWWELVEAWKKLFLVGFMVLVLPGTIEQLMIAFVFALVHMLVISVAQPFKDDLDDHFAKACAFGLTALCFFSLVLKVGVLTEAVDGVLSAQLRERFGFDAAFVTVGMVLSTVAALALVALMAAHQLARAALLPVLRLEATKAAPELLLAPGHLWHLFLSHIWGTGQDQCATIKRQLCLLLPGVSIFLDVDDLTDIGALETYVDQTAVIMIFVSKGYFKSKNCLREVRCTVAKGKPIALVHDAVRGGAPLAVCRDEECPTELRGAVFDGREVIEWHRIKDFQLVSLKLLAEQMLLGCARQDGIGQNAFSVLAAAAGAKLYVPHELPLQRLALRSKPRVYVSADNPGAAAVATDLWHGMGHAFELLSSSECDAAAATHFLLYLNDETYLGAAGARLAAQLESHLRVSSKTRPRRAAHAVQIVMVHENDPARGGCEFGIFFDGRTPQELLQAGLYSDLALALCPGAFWPVSVALVAKAGLGAHASRLRGAAAFTTHRALRSPPPPGRQTEARAPSHGSTPDAQPQQAKGGANDAASGARDEVEDHDIKKRKTILQEADDFHDLHGHKDAPEGHLRHSSKANARAHASLFHELNEGVQDHAHRKLETLKTKPTGSGLARRPGDPTPAVEAGSGDGNLPLRKTLPEPEPEGSRAAAPETEAEHDSNAPRNNQRPSELQTNQPPSSLLHC